MLSSALPTFSLTLCHWAILMSSQLMMVFNCWPRDAMMLSEVKAPISATSGDLSAAEACPVGGKRSRETYNSLAHCEPRRSTREGHSRTSR